MRRTRPGRRATVQPAGRRFPWDGTRTPPAPGEPRSAEGDNRRAARAKRPLFSPGEGPGGLPTCHVHQTFAPTLPPQSATADSRFPVAPLLTAPPWALLSPLGFAALLLTETTRRNRRDALVFPRRIVGARRWLAGGAVRRVPRHNTVQSRSYQLARPDLE